MFGQDSDSVGEFCSVNVVYHLFRKPNRETQNGAKLSVVAKGCWILARPQEGGKCRVMDADNLTAIYTWRTITASFCGFQASLLA